MINVCLSRESKYSKIYKPSFINKQIYNIHFFFKNPTMMTT